MLSATTTAATDNTYTNTLMCNELVSLSVIDGDWCMCDTPVTCV